MNQSPHFQKELDTAVRLLLFDLALGGHHGNYIQYLVEYFYEFKLKGTIDIIVLPEFCMLHHDVVEAVSRYHSFRVKLTTILPREAEALGSRDSSIKRSLRNFREWLLFCKYAKALQPTQAMIMYLDTCELPLAVGMKSPCPFSGIYFRPTFHYNTFTNYHPSRKEKLQQYREKITLGQILRHPQLQTVFCLDPFAVKALNANQHQAKVIHLADPVQITPPISLEAKALRAALKIEPQRRVFLLFGALDGRKGIYQLLEAIQILPIEHCQKLCLLLVGKTSSAEQAQIQKKATALRQTQPIQLIECYDFIPENEVPNYFQLADIVLAPYQRHVGMSGILLLAAAAGKPVLSSNYGLMGELVRRYQLGLTVDSTIPEAITQGLVRCIQESFKDLGDYTQMKAFAEQNSVNSYASTIFQTLYPHSNNS